MDDLKEALNISGFEDLHSIRFPDGREEHGSGDLFEQLEKVISHDPGILGLLLSFLEEQMEGRIHLIDQFIDPLSFELGGDPKEGFAMGWEFDLSVSVKDSRMISNAVSLDHDFQMVGIGEELTRQVDVRGGDGVAVGLELDKPGLGDGGQDDSIGTIRDRRKGFELFFLQGFYRRLLRDAMDPLIPLDPPETELSV